MKNKINKTMVKYCVISTAVVAAIFTVIMEIFRSIYSAKIDAASISECFELVKEFQDIKFIFGNPVLMLVIGIAIGYVLYRKKHSSED